MRILIAVLFVMGGLGFTMAQSTVKLKLVTDETIEGEWLGMENDHYLVGMTESTILYIPQEMVYKTKIKSPLHLFPKYDENKNGVIWGISGEFNSTLGDEPENLKGLGIKAFLGYDWNHDYALLVSVGYRDMNIGSPETFIPVSITPIKYFTEGRFLLYGGLAMAYNYGVHNQWSSTNSPLTGWRIGPNQNMSQPRHDRGHGPSITPLVGVRMIGKHGIDQVLSLGFHLQKFKSEQLFEDDHFSRIDLLYKRWQISYGMIF